MARKIPVRMRAEAETKHRDLALCSVESKTHGVELPNSFTLMLRKWV